MRRRFHDATEHESDVRDGAHGLLVWAGALVVGAIIAVGGIGCRRQRHRQRRRHRHQRRVQCRAGCRRQSAAASALDPNAYFTDELFRLPAGAAAPAGTTRPTAAAKPAASSRPAPPRAPSRPTTRPISASSSRSNTGLPADQATARVDQVLKAIDDAKAKAADAAETARKTAVLAAFLTAASLLVSRRRRLLGGDEGRTPSRRRHRVRRRLRPLLIRRIKNASWNRTLAARRADLADHHHRAVRPPLSGSDADEIKGGPSGPPSSRIGEDVSRPRAAPSGRTASRRLRRRAACAPARPASAARSG